MSDTLARVPPQDLQAEQSVLGAILLDNDAISEALQVLNPGDLYRETHRVIFTGMSALYERNQPIDAVTLTDVLRSMRKLEDIGGPAYIAELAQCVPTAANIVHYATIVRDKGLLRRTAEVLTRGASEAYDNPHDPETLLDRIERDVLAIKRSNAGTISAASEIVGDELAALHRGMEGEVSGGVVYTGFTKLDEATGGLGPTDLAIIGARPSMGKTGMCVQISDNVLTAGKAVLFFSAEMSKSQIVERMLCNGAQLDLLTYRNAKRGRVRLSTKQVENVHREAERISTLPLFVDDLPGTIGLIRAKARRYARRHSLGLIVLDYLQLVESGDERVENHEQKLAQISKGMKLLAKELHVPALVCAQLNRQCELRPGKRPLMADLRGSGQLEQDADVIVLLHRPVVYEATAQSSLVELHLCKQRNGPTARIDMTFTASYARFEDR